MIGIRNSLADQCIKFTAMSDVVLIVHVQGKILQLLGIASDIDP